MPFKANTRLLFSTKCWWSMEENAWLQIGECVPTAPERWVSLNFTFCLHQMGSRDSVLVLRAVCKIIVYNIISVIFPFFKIQDTNPIFLFNKEMILCDRAPAIPKTTFSTENDMEIKVEESLMMPAVFHTVASRTQLAVVRSKQFF